MDKIKTKISFILFILSSCYLPVFFLTTLPCHADWAERTLESMSVREKVGQLFVVPACQLGQADHLEDLYRMVGTYHIGGILLKQGTIDGQIKLIEILQERSPTPLLCVQDAEWGLSMRLTDAIRFPRNLTLGAIQDPTLIYALGKEIGRQCRISGIHFNCSPVADVSSNPRNPIIHTRSFGDDPNHVALYATQMMLGIQSEGVIACGKHFPGHGDTSVDSHYDLPIVLHDRKRLEEVEWVPFQSLIENGVGALMSAHLFVPALESRPQLPATFSASVLECAHHMGFEGLWITDALNMKAIARYFSPQETALLAHEAGNDLLLYGDHIAPNIDEILRVQIPAAIEALVAHYSVVGAALAPLDAHVLKILKAKQDVCFPRRIGCIRYANQEEMTLELKRKLFEAAITEVHAEPGLLPLQREGKVAVVSIGALQPFIDELSKECVVDAFDLERLDFEGYSHVVLALSGIYPWEKHLGELEALQAIKAKHPQVIAVMFDSPYCAQELAFCDALILAYENDPDAQSAAAKVLLGKLPPLGRLPVESR
jgi:beta-glucosidase-like glycosyl hydrolase